MKILCDVHISYRLVNFLISKNIDAIHVNTFPDRWNTKDKIIAEWCDTNDAILITKDEDFLNSHFIKQSPKKLIRITLGNISNSMLIEIIEKNLHFNQGKIC